MRKYKFRISKENRYPYVIAEIVQLFLNIKKEINLLYKAGLFIEVHKKFTKIVSTHT